MEKVYKSITQQDITIGQFATKRKMITEEDVNQFAKITGDMNPAHVDEEFAHGSLFKTKIAHGMIGASLISACLGMVLPGPGSIYLGQNLKFVHPIYFGDTITARVEVVKLIDKKKFILAELHTTIVNQKSELLIDGTAKVIPPEH